MRILAAFESNAWFLDWNKQLHFVSSYSSAKYGICLLVNSCLGIGAKSFSSFEERGVGVQWSNIVDSPSADDDFSLAQVFLMFIVEIIMYGLFAWYVKFIFRI